jgi:hypothetical protein
MLVATLDGLDPGIYAFILERLSKKTWMAGSSPAKAMETRRKQSRYYDR